MNKTKICGGFTLLEAVIALALWLILSGGVFLVWNHGAASGTAMLERQSAFENARLAMDALKMNIQMARRVNLQTDTNNVLDTLVLNQINPEGQWHDYTFTFDVNASSTATAFQRLNFGGQEFASNLAKIQIMYIPTHRMRIIITTGCDEPLVLEGSVCVRYKEVNLT